MTGSIFDYWQALVGLIAIVGVWIAWKSFKKPSKRIVQTMTNSENSEQIASQADTEQKMDNVKHGKQNT